MQPSRRQLVLQLARRVLGEEPLERILAMPFADLGHGYDCFGQERETGLAAYLANRWLYTRYFRVESRGHEHIPKQGRAILVGNHSGLLPFDGMMLGIDILERCVPPRAMRAIADRFLAGLPYVGVFLARCGQVIGHRRNFEHLLEAEELVAVFPEGAEGLGKAFGERYRLRPFHPGFVELALAYRVPLVPFAVVGAEEQAPILWKSVTLARSLGVPYFPITPTWPWLGPLGLFPYPARYHIAYGEPVHLYRQYGPEAAHRPEVVRPLAAALQDTVQALVDDERSRRGAIFR